LDHFSIHYTAKNISQRGFVSPLAFNLSEQSVHCAEGLICSRISLLGTLCQMAVSRPFWTRLSATETTESADMETSLEQANKAVAQRFYEEIVNQKTWAP
jgi:hypothetical protein